MTTRPQCEHRDRHLGRGWAPAAVASTFGVATAVVALTFVASPADAIVPPSTTPPAPTAAPSHASTTGTSQERPVEHVFTLTVGGTNPTVAGWPLLAGPNYELESDGTLYVRGAPDADRLYPELLVVSLDDVTTAHLVVLLGAVDIGTVGGSTEYSSTLTHPPVAILVAGDGTADETFTSYRIAESGELPPATTAPIALIDELDALVTTVDAEPLTSGRAIVVAQPTTIVEAGDPSPWPAPVGWSAMAPSIGDARCVVVEGDAVAAALDAYQVPHGPQQIFDTGDGTLVVTGIRMLMPSEAGCPSP